MTKNQRTERAPRPTTYARVTHITMPSNTSSSSFSLPSLALCKSRFRPPARKKMASRSILRQQACPLHSLPVELLAKILDFFHTKTIKLSLALVCKRFAEASARCNISYPFGPSFAPLHNLLRQMQLEEIGCISSTRVKHTKQTFAVKFANEGVFGGDACLRKELAESLLRSTSEITTERYTLLCGDESHKLANSNAAWDCEEQCDVFARKYVNHARHQQVATHLDYLPHERRWRFRGDLANFARTKETEQIYLDLETLFQASMGALEQTVAYAWRLAPSKPARSALQLRSDETDNGIACESYEEIPFVSLVSPTGSSVQVYVSFEECLLAPGESREETSWQVEGLPQEHIVATVQYVVERDDAFLVGGHLQFKRALLVGEAHDILDKGQAARVHKVFPNGLVPLGSVPAKQGRLVCFANSHVHNCARLVNTSNTVSAKQRSILLHLVNPKRRVPSTQDVASSSLRVGRQEELLAERSTMTQNWNVHALRDPWQRAVEARENAHQAAAAAVAVGGFYM